jgi:hypothetical protein
MQDFVGLSQTRSEERISLEQCFNLSFRLSLSHPQTTFGNLAKLMPKRAADGHDVFVLLKPINVCS